MEVGVNVREEREHMLMRTVFPVTPHWKVIPHTVYMDFHIPLLRYNDPI